MLEKYKTWLIVNGNSNNTVINYEGRIKKFLQQIELENINEENIINYLLELGKIYAPSTVNGYRDTIKSFLEFLKKDIPIPQHLKLDKKLPDSITEGFLEKELIPVAESIFINPLRVKTILYFMFYTGIRIGEMDILKRKDIDLTNRRAKLFGKGRKERIVFFNERIKEILEGYFAIEPEDTNAFNTKREALRAIFKKMRTYFKDVNIYPHLLRHSFATHLLRKGIDVSIVSKLLGHNSIQSTMRYLALDTQLIQKVYDEKIK